jgi:hypothetical protein
MYQIVTLIVGLGDLLSSSVGLMVHDVRGPRRVTWLDLARKESDQHNQSDP